MEISVTARTSSMLYYRQNIYIIGSSCAHKSFGETWEDRCLWQPQNLTEDGILAQKVKTTQTSDWKKIIFIGTLGSVFIVKVRNTEE